ncbi:MAG: cysteine hydrolase [bacterium]|nr:cysteine hydrolase [bacterium]
MQKKALFVSDIQRYFFCPSSKAYIRDSEKIVEKINVLTRLYENRSHFIIFTGFVDSERQSSPMRKWWNHMPSYEESRLYEKLYVPKHSCIITKYSYSAFAGTRLENELRDKKVEDILFCGVMTHLCVESNVRNAFELGYLCRVVKDCCASSRPSLHRASLAVMEHGFAQITTLKEIIEENK